LLLSYFGAWQFLLTGGIMVCNLLLLAQLQWDMRSPLEDEFLPVQIALDSIQPGLKQPRFR
jgi:hypothetical protein